MTSFLCDSVRVKMVTATTQRADRAPGNAGPVRNFLDGQGLTGRFCYQGSKVSVQKIGIILLVSYFSCA